MNQKPAHEIRNGGIKATIWPNEGNGKPRHTVSVIRNFKAGEEWRQSTSFHRSDLPKLIAVLTEAETWMTTNEPSPSN